MAFFKRTKFGGKRKPSSMPDGLWVKCEGCSQTVYRSDIRENDQICPTCGHHYRLDARSRLELVLDADSFEETHAAVRTADPLEFSVGKETYEERIERAKKSSGLDEAVITGFGAIEGHRLAIAVMDSSFVMASMGSAVGEKLCRFIGDAVRERTAAVIFTASGGARMQEGILALMQMAKTSDAVRQMNEAGLPYICVLTDPTTGGVFASFASLGDITLAEPKAYVGFAGGRLIEGALKVKLPDGFQRSEYQFDNGFVDRIVPRGELRGELGKLISYLCPNPVPEHVTEDSAEDVGNSVEETASEGKGPKKKSRSKGSAKEKRAVETASTASDGK
jgi:acetyl-CoA carboxylase carboxyl transferase subunit beta